MSPSVPTPPLPERRGLIDVPSEAPGRGRLAAGVVLGFLLLLSGAGAVDALYPTELQLSAEELRQLEGPGYEGASWRDGSLARELETNLRLRSRTRSWVLGPYATALFLVLDEAGRNTLRGQDGWMFMGYRAIPPAGLRAERGELAAALMAAVQSRVEALGLRFVALPVPRKAVVHEGLLPPGVDNGAALDRAHLAGLARRGVRAVDALRLWGALEGEPAYYPTDSHWGQSAQMLAIEEALRLTGDLVPEEQRRTRLLPAARLTPFDRFDLLRFSRVELSKERLWALRRQGVWCYQTLATTPTGQFPPGLGVTRQRGKILLSGTSFCDNPTTARVVTHFGQCSVLHGALSAAGLLEPLHKMFATLGVPAGLETVVLEYPLHQIFFHEAEDGSLVLPEYAGELFARQLPEERMTVLTRASFEIEEEFRVNEWRDLVPGERRLVARLPLGRLAHSGDGSATLHLRGEGAGKTTTVLVHCGGATLPVRWPLGEMEVNLPLLAPATTRGEVVIEVLATAEGYFRVADLQIIAEHPLSSVRPVPCELQRGAGGEWEVAATLQPRPLVGTRSVLGLSLNSDEAGGPIRVADVEVELRAGDGQVLRYELGELTGNGSFLGRLAPLAGKRIASITARGRGAVVGVNLALLGR